MRRSSSVAGAPASVPLPQYSLPTVLAVWAAAALPMGLLAWVVAPALAGQVRADRRFAVTLMLALTGGLIWQFLLVLALVAREQKSLRWPVVRDALWLVPPSDAAGRRGGRLWLWVVVFALGFGLLQLIPLDLGEPSDRSFAEFLASDQGTATFRGAWRLFGLVVVLALFNTVLGEELLFRGLLLPRMRGTFGSADWLANGVLFGLYHLHQPWAIPGAVLAGVLLFAYPTSRFRSAWMGIAIHSAQSVVVVALVLALVIS